jgi:hypothetical protein
VQIEVSCPLQVLFKTQEALSHKLEFMVSGAIRASISPIRIRRFGQML